MVRSYCWVLVWVNFLVASLLRVDIIGVHSFFDDEGYFDMFYSPEWRFFLMCSNVFCFSAC